jgi:hypothetical protein
VMHETTVFTMCHMPRSAAAHRPSCGQKHKPHPQSKRFNTISQFIQAVFMSAIFVRPLVLTPEHLC